MKQLTPEQQTKLDKFISALASAFTDEVKCIEAKPETTQYHYGDYGGLINTLSSGKSDTAKIIAAALIKAGANATGVTNGLNLLVLGTGY